MKEWLSKPQNISPLFPLPYIHLLSEVLPVQWGNAGWWLQKCGLQIVASRGLVPVQGPVCSLSPCSLAKKISKRKLGSCGKKTLFCLVCKSCSVRVPVTLMLNFSSSYMHTLLLGKGLAWSCCLFSSEMLRGNFLKISF